LFKEPELVIEREDEEPGIVMERAPESSLLAAQEKDKKERRMAAKKGRTSVFLQILR